MNNYYTLDAVKKLLKAAWGLHVIGTIIATLTRKSKSVETMPKYEMVTYYKGSSIPNSHVHMYDPDNVTVACSIFRVSPVAFVIRPDNLTLKFLDVLHTSHWI